MSLSQRHGHSERRTTLELYDNHGSKGGKCPIYVVQEMNDLEERTPLLTYLVSLFPLGKFMTLQPRGPHMSSLCLDALLPLLGENVIFT